MLTVAVVLAIRTPVFNREARAIQLRVAAYYPSWRVDAATIDRRWGWGGGTTIIVYLQWRGAENIRYRVYHWSGSSWQGDPFLDDSEAAAAFIKAFKSRHPESGWVVSLPTVTTLADGRRYDVSFEQFLEAWADYRFSRAAHEVWEVHYPNGVPEWTYHPEFHPGP